MGERTDILLASGSYFDFENPSASSFWIDDIAEGLSKLCRFNGQCRMFYSVAQHCVLVSRTVERRYAMAGLLHDAAEAFVGDVTRPLKLLLPDYRAVEQAVEAAIFERFGIAEIPPEVKHADLVLLATEQRDLMPHHDDEWACIQNIEPLAKKIEPWGPRRARQEFRTRFLALGGRVYLSEWMQ